MVASIRPVTTVIVPQPRRQGRRVIAYLIDADSPSPRSSAEVRAFVESEPLDSGSPFVAALARSVRAHGAREAFVGPSGVHTFDDLWTLSGTVARAVQSALGAAAGASPAASPGHVGILFPNSAAYVAAWLGVLRAGGVVVPLPLSMDQAQARAYLERTQCSLLLTSAENAELATSAQPLPAEDSGTSLEPAPVDPNTLATLLCTSGTTGRRKITMLSHENLRSNAEAITAGLGLTLADRALASLPFQHAFGNSVLTSHLMSGGALVVDHPIAMLTAPLDVARRKDVTCIYGTPELLGMLARLGAALTAPSSLRFAALAGGAAPRELAREVAAAMPSVDLYLMYGQTEATARLSILAPRDFDRKSHSIGKGIAETELVVRRPDGTEADPGERGILYARGPGVFLGYWDDSERTADALDDGWLRTEDMAERDEDGFVTVFGRADRVCKVGGYCVGLAELEQAVRSKLVASEVVAFSYTAKRGFDRLAVIVETHADEVTEDAVRAVCRGELPAGIVPEVVRVEREVPRTPAGKPDYRRLIAGVEYEYGDRVDE